MLKILLITLIIFLPKYGIIDLSFFLSITVIIFYTLVLKTKSIEKLYLFKNEFLFFTVLLLYFSAQSIINILFLDEIYLPYYLAKFSRLLVNFMAIFYLLNNFKQNSVFKLLNFIFISNLVVVFFELLFPMYRELIYSITNFHNSAPIIYRVAGLSLGFDAAGMIIVIGGLYYLVKIKFNIGNNKLNKLLYFLHFIGTLFTARVAFLTLLIVSLAYIVISSFKSILKFSKLLLYLFIVILAILAILNLADIDFGGYEYAFNRTLNVTRYSNDSNDLFHSSKSIESIFRNIFGYGIDVFSKYGARSDVGFFQLYWAGGIMGFILIFLFYIYIFIYGIKHIKNSFFSLLIILSIMAIFIGNFKGGYIFARGQSELLFIFLIVLKSGVYNESRTIIKN